MAGRLISTETVLTGYLFKICLISLHVHIIKHISFYQIYFLAQIDFCSSIYFQPAYLLFVAPVGHLGHV